MRSFKMYTATTGAAAVVAAGVALASASAAADTIRIGDINSY